MINFEATMIKFLILLFIISILNVLVVNAALIVATPKKKKSKEEESNYLKDYVRQEMMFLSPKKEVIPVNKMTYKQFKQYERELKKRGIL